MPSLLVNHLFLPTHTLITELINFKYTLMFVLAWRGKKMKTEEGILKRRLDIRRKNISSVFFPLAWLTLLLWRQADLGWKIALKGKTFKCVVIIYFAGCVSAWRQQERSPSSLTSLVNIKVTRSKRDLPAALAKANVVRDHPRLFMGRRCQASRHAS